jgi:hypothetical protein
MILEMRQLILCENISIAADQVLSHARIPAGCFFSLSPLRPLSTPLTDVLDTLRQSFGISSGRGRDMG